MTQKPTIFKSLAGSIIKGLPSKIYHRPHAPFLYFMNPSQSADTPNPWGSLNAWLILLSCAGLLAIWPMPGTIALRHGLLTLGFIASLISLLGHKKAIFSLNTWPLWIFLGFYLWLLVHLFFLSTDFDAQLYELGHLWMRCLMAIPLGLALSLMLVKPKTTHPQIETEVRKDDAWQNSCILLILIGFAGTCLIGFARFSYEMWHNRQWMFDQIYFLYFFYKAKPPFVICTALAAPLSFILIIRGINRQMSRWWIAPGILILALCIFGDYFSNTKNGIAIFVLCLSVFVINLVLRIKWSWEKIILALLISIVIASFSFAGIKKHLEKNTAWAQMIADVQISADIQHQNWWKDDKVGSVPTNSQGRPVDGSTYLRTAWFVSGVQLLIENPLGYGLVHHSFGALAAQKWSDFSKPLGNMRGATHSGWLDFALGVGIPGLLLVLIPLFVSWYRSLHQEGLWFSYAAWTIPIMSFAYLTTEANEAHFIELLFFMTAFFCGITLRYPAKRIKS